MEKLNVGLFAQLYLYGGVSAHPISNLVNILSLH